MGRPPSKRWPLEPLMRLVGARSMVAFADAVGVDRREVYRWRDAGGVTDVMADRLTVVFGTTPGEVWSDWFDDEIARQEAELEERRSRRLERDREESARWRAEHPGEVAAYQERYRRLHAESKARYSRSYYRRHRDVLLAKQRERDRARRGRVDAA